MEAEKSEVPSEPQRHYLNVEYGIRSWLLTTDHKRIALLYLSSITFMFVIGGAAAVLFRLELVTPPGDLVMSETYNKLFTIHGIIMVFFFLIPSIPATLDNFLVPMMIGARIDPRSGLSHSDSLLYLVHALRQGGRSQSVAGHRA